MCVCVRMFINFASCFSFQLRNPMHVNNLPRTDIKNGETMQQIFVGNVADDSKTSRRRKGG